MAMISHKARSTGRRSQRGLVHGSAWIAQTVLMVAGVLWGLDGQRAGELPAAEQDSPIVDDALVGYWKLHGDCRDYSGKGNHGINHGASLETGEFNGRGSYVEVPSAASLDLGKGDFSVCACLNQAEIGKLSTPLTGS